MSDSQTSSVMDAMMSEELRLKGKALLEKASQKHSETRRFFMWFCAACFYFFQFILRTSPSVIANDLMRSLSLDGLALGVLVSYYYYGYSAMQIPSGLLLDRIGPRRPLTVACLLCLSGALIFSLFESVAALSFGRLMMGIGSAFGFISCVKIASQAFLRRRLSMYISLTMLLGTIGATSAGKPFAVLVDIMEWRSVHLILAGLSLVLAVSIWCIVPDGNQFSHHTNENEKAVTKETVIESISHILGNPQTWLYGAYGFMMYVPLAGFADLWGVPYLVEVYGVDRQTASGANSAIYIGLGLGGPLWSMYVAKVQSYKKGMVMGAYLTTLFVSLLLFIPNLSFNLCVILLFLIGASSTSQFISFAGVTEMNSEHRTGVASGIHNMLCMMSGVIMQPFLGYVLKSLWNGSYVCEVPHYTKQDFQTALLVLPVCVLIAALAIYFVKETYPKDE